MRDVRTFLAFPLIPLCDLPSFHEDLFQCSLDFQHYIVTNMATLEVVRSASDYVSTANPSIKRTLDLYASELDYELPPAVKVKTNSQPELVLPFDEDIHSAEDLVPPETKVSAAEKVADLQPDYGHRLIPSLIDNRAQEDPQRPVWSIPCSSNLADGFRDINYGQVAQAINRAAWWIDENVGKSTTFETLAYMGPPDLRYAILTVAAQKTGHTVSRRPIVYERKRCLCIPGFLLFAMEQHRSAPTPSRIHELSSLHHSIYSLTRRHSRLGQTRNETSHYS